MTQNRAFKGIWIPAEIWEAQMPIMEKVMLVEIDSLDNENGCFASNSYFAEFFGLSKGRVSQIIKSLESKGLINIKYEYGNKNITKRIIKIKRNFNNTLFNKLNTPIKYSKHPYLENAKDNNTELIIQSDTEDALNHYQNKIGVISPNQMQQLFDWINDFNENNEGEQIVIEAINQSAKENARAFKYVNTKLQMYINANVKTLQDAKSFVSTSKKQLKSKKETPIEKRLREAKEKEDRQSGNDANTGT